MQDFWLRVGCVEAQGSKGILDTRHEEQRDNEKEYYRRGQKDMGGEKKLDVWKGV